MHAANVTTNLDFVCLPEVNTTFAEATNETQDQFHLEEGLAEIQNLPNAIRTAPRRWIIPYTYKARCISGPNVTDEPTSTFTTTNN